MKNKFQSLTEKGRWLLATLTLIFTLGIGQMWAENVTLPTTALTLPANGLSSNWGTTQAKHFYYNDATNHYTIYLPYALRVNSSTQTWFAQTGTGSSANATWAALDGTIFKGYTYYEIKDKDGKERYDKIKKSTGGVHNFRVKNCTKVVAYVKLGKKGDEITAKAYEVSAGVVSSTASVTGSHTNSSSATAGTINLNNLDYTKEYVITVHQSTGGSDGIFYEIAFYNHAYTVTYNAGEGSGTVPTETDKDPGAKFNLGSASGLSHDGGKSFLGWKDQDDNTYEAGYEYTMPVKNVILTAQWGTPASTFDITFKNGGHGTAPDAINASKVTLAELSAEGYLHKGWVANKAVTVDENPVAAGTLIANGKTAFVSEATEFTAQWATVWTVTYYDGATSLGTEIVENGNAPAEYAAKQTKTLASFVSWYSDAQLNTPIADITALSITANTPIYGKWNKAYAESIDMEQFVIDNKKSGNWKDYLDAANIAYSADGLSLDSLDSSKGNNNYPYLGLKFNKNKTADLYVTGNLKAGKLMIVKVGNISSTHMDIDGVTQTTPAIVGGTDTEPACTYWYYNADKEFKLVKTNSGTASVLKAIVITDPYVVTYNANGGDPVSPATFYGTALTLPNAENGTASFLGWFDAETGGNKIGEAGDSYIPTASIELFAHWESISTDARLASITFSSAAGTLSPAFDPEVVNYTYTMPYPTASIPTITGATSVNANAQAPIIGEAAAAWGDAQTIKGVAQSGDKKTYTITMQIEPKDGVSLVKIEPTSQTKGTQTGLYPNGDELTINLSSGMNLGGSGKYIGVKATENFQEGDVLHLDLNAKPNTTGSTQIILYAEKEATNEVWATGELASEAKDYYLTLPAAVNGHKELYIVRTDGNKWNGGPSVMEVTRAMNPMLTAMTIDGRTVTINEAAKTATVTIPYEADLAALTITKTIVWNAPATENSIVVNDGSAWTLGENTYKLTDKDGDATTYTITVARDVLKHTVRFMDGTSEFASALVVDGESPVAPATDPEKEDYLFQGWAETVDGDVITDWSTISISAAKDFYAKWVSDGAIKLIEAGAINTTNFVTGGTLSSGTVSVDEVNYKYITLAGTNGEIGSASNVTTDRFVMYHATTTKTKIQIHAYANGNARQVRLSGLVEGASTLGLQQTINVAKNDDELTEYFSFDSDKHRTFYITIPSSASDVYLLQVKVIESGEPLAAIGTAGTSFNFNKGRLFAPQSVATSFDGIDIKTYNKYAALSTEYAELSDGAISFYVPNDVCLSVASNANGTNKYYVTNEVTGTDNETTTANAEFNLTGGKTWYIRLADSSKRVRFTNIAFTAPKCEKPTITAQPATKQTFGPGNLTATVVAATPTDGGTLKYQWYVAATDEEVENATEATLTTTTEGTYYVIVTNTLADHSDNSVKSANATLGYRVMDDATLKSLKYGTTAIALEDGVYNYNVELAKGTTDVPALSATAKMDGYADVDINDAAEFVNYEASSTVTVKSEDLTETNVYTVNFYVKHDLPQVDVTESTTWDWTNAATTMQTIKPAKKDSVQLMANIDDNGKKLKNDAEFNSQALLFKGQEALTEENSRWYAKGGHIKFNVTVPGIVKVEFSDNGNNNRRLKINNYVSSEASATKTDVKNFAAYVMPGEVTLMGVKNDGTGTDQYIRISKIEFIAKATPDYERNVTNNIGTLCVDHNVLVGGALGATFYQIASRNELYNDKIDFEEVLPTEELKAGEPYIFQSTTGKIELFYGETVATQPSAVRGMIGNYAASTLAINEDNQHTILYIAENKLWSCENIVGSTLKLNPNRAYINMELVPTYAEYQEAQTSNPAPRRRVTLGKDAEQVVTGVENLNASEQPVKLLINGQIFILRGEKMFDATGRLVK